MHNMNIISQNILCKTLNLNIDFEHINGGGHCTLTMSLCSLPTTIELFIRLGGEQSRWAFPFSIIRVWIIFQLLNYSNQFTYIQPKLLTTLIKHFIFNNLILLLRPRIIAYFHVLKVNNCYTFQYNVIDFGTTFGTHFIHIHLLWDCTLPSYRGGSGLLMLHSGSGTFVLLNKRPLRTQCFIEQGLINTINKKIMILRK